MMYKEINTWDKDFPELPVLVLGLEIKEFYYDTTIIKYSPLRYNLTTEREWHLISHQTGGLLCNHIKILGTILKVTEETKNKIKDFSHSYYGTDIFVPHVSLNELNLYRKNLENFLGVDCNNSYQVFEEGVYPIDVAYLNKLTIENLPEDLDDLIIWNNKNQKLYGGIGRWSLWIFGENSD